MFAYINSLKGTVEYNRGRWHVISGQLVGAIGRDGSTFIGSFGSSTWIYQNGQTHKVNTPEAYEFG
jgi:hypothetical protein